MRERIGIGLLCAFALVLLPLGTQAYLSPSDVFPDVPVEKVEPKVQKPTVNTKAVFYRNGQAVGQDSGVDEDPENSDDSEEQAVSDNAEVMDEEYHQAVPANEESVDVEESPSDEQDTDESENDFDELDVYTNTEDIIQELDSEEEVEDDSSDSEEAEEVSEEDAAAVVEEEAKKAAPPQRQSLAYIIIKRGKYLFSLVGLGIAGIMALLLFRKKGAPAVKTQPQQQVPANNPAGGPSSAEESSPRLKKALEAMDDDGN